MDILDLLSIGRDSNESLENIKNIGTFTVGDTDVRRVDNNALNTHSVTFPLTGVNASGEEVRVVKFAKLRSSASLDAPQYKIYVGKLTADYKDKDGNFNKDKDGREVGKKGDMDFYAESIGGTPRVNPNAMPSADSTTPPFGG